MTYTADTTPPPDRELVRNRMIHAPREKVFKAWIHPELLKKWAAPLQPFTTLILTLEDENGGRTRYTARVGHRAVAGHEAHDKMCQPQS